MDAELHEYVARQGERRSGIDRRAALPIDEAARVLTREGIATYHALRSTGHVPWPPVSILERIGTCTMLCPVCYPRERRLAHV